MTHYCLSMCQRWTSAKRIIQFFFNKGENARQANENMFLYDIFNVKEELTIVEIIYKILEIVESDRHVSIVSFTDNLNRLEPF